MGTLESRIDNLLPDPRHCRRERRRLRQAGEHGRTGQIPALHAVEVGWLGQLAGDLGDEVLAQGTADAAIVQLDQPAGRALGLVTAASLIAASLILNSTRKVLLFEVDFFGVQTLSVTDLLGFTGYIIATFLGLWLVFSIVRSGKL